jgi:asparagine synthase (glutamine-hydrolysing)
MLLAQVGVRDDSWSEKARFPREPAVAMWSDAGCQISANEMAQSDEWVAAGAVRLDGHQRKPRANQAGAELWRLAVALQSNDVRRVGGRFGAVVWNRRSRTLYAIRDHLGLSPLYYELTSGGLRVSDSLQALGRSELNKEFVSEFIATGGCVPELTIYRHVRQVPSGSVIAYRNGVATISSFWRPNSNESYPGTLQEAGEQLLSLLKASLADCIDASGKTWAHFSGGLDSSSVVCAASVVADNDPEKRLGGTVTLSDNFANADETSFVDPVVGQLGIRNERIKNDWPWRDDGDGQPMADCPSRDYPWWSRDREMARIVRARGGTSILSGIGPDVYFPGTSRHVADLMWSGRVAESLRVLYTATMAQGQSLWKTLPADLVIPVVCPSVGRWRERHKVSVPKWLHSGFVKHTEFATRVQALQNPASRRGNSYAAAADNAIQMLGATVHAWHPLPGVDVRHPFLTVGLVEFIQTLPYRFRTNAFWSKPVLRFAMKGILPEPIRTRRTKGTLEPRICWSFARERRLLTQLLTNSTLADLGCIEPRAAIEALNGWANGRGQDALFLYSMLSLETWLARLSGRCMNDPEGEQERRPRMEQNHGIQAALH